MNTDMVPSVKGRFSILVLATAIMGGFALWFQSCEEPFDPGISDEREEIVVEGYIEWSPDNSIPPYVILSRSFPFTETIDAEFVSMVFVSDADVSISDGDQTVALSRLCLDELPDAIRNELTDALGLDSLLSNFCLYLDISNELTIEPGRSYELEVLVEDRRITSNARIPRPVQLDSLWAIPSPNPGADSLAQLRLKLSDPPGADFYRYFTSVDGGPLIPPLASVTDDALFDGQSFEVNILKAEPRGTDFDPETFGYFDVGDDVVLKWCTLERAQFRFWETLEYSRNNQGPFSSYTLVESNVEGEGGLGVFGTQCCFYYEIKIPDEF